MCDINTSLECIKLLLDAGAETNLKDIWGSTALLYCYHDTTIELLLQYGADANLQNDDGVNALIRFCHSRENNKINISTLMLLIHQTSDVTIKDKFNRSAYDYIFRHSVCDDDYIRSLLSGKTKMSNTKSARNKLC